METKYRAPKFVAFDVYALAFGYRAFPFPMGVNDNLLPKPAQQLSTLGSVLLKRDKNGTEAFCPVVINHNGKKYDLPYSTISITMRKNIQKTALPGRQGSVKELIQIEDYQFTVQGVVLGAEVIENGTKVIEGLPEEGIKELNELFSINEPIRLENAFAEIFLPKDNRVVIESMDLPEMKGVTGAQAYTITLSSDTILELEEK
jgi:hypothetical protein